MGTISNLLKAVAAFFGFAKQESTLRNTPQMQANGQGKQLQADKDAAAKAVDDPNLTDLRDETAE